MQIRSESHGDVVVLKLEQGPESPDESLELVRTLNKLHASGFTRVVLDVGALPFIDSTGLGVIFGSSTTLRASGGGLALACPGSFFRRMLNVLELHRVFPAFDSVEAAIRFLRGDDDGAAGSTADLKRPPGTGSGHARPERSDP